jgi:hypothetical protein
MEIGRKIYYDKTTGNVYVDVVERSGDVVETTQEDDFQVYTALHGIDPITVGAIQLEFAQYADNFKKYPFHIDPATEQIVWDTSPQLTLDATIQAKLAQLDDLCRQSLQAFTSNALGALHTYLSRSDMSDNDWALYTAEFTFVTGVYYDNNPINWYTVESGNVVHSKDQFVRVFLDARGSVSSRKEHLAHLEAQVQSYANATDITAAITSVNAITWTDSWVPPVA